MTAFEVLLVVLAVSGSVLFVTQTAYPLEQAPWTGHMVARAVLLCVLLSTFLGSALLVGKRAIDGVVEFTRYDQAQELERLRLQCGEPE